MDLLEYVRLFTVLFIFSLTESNENTLFHGYLGRLFSFMLPCVVILFVCNTIRFICYYLYSTWGLLQILVEFICSLGIWNMTVALTDLIR